MINVTFVTAIRGEAVGVMWGGREREMEREGERASETNKGDSLKFQFCGEKE